MHLFTRSVPFLLKYFTIKSFSWFYFLYNEWVSSNSGVHIQKQSKQNLKMVEIYKNKISIATWT